MKKIEWRVLSALTARGRMAFAVLTAAFALSVPASAQQGLAGRVYQHSDILKEGMQKHAADFDKNVEQAKAEAVAKEEKKKGRKLTESELSEMDRKSEEARKMLDAVLSGTKTAVTVTFKSDTEVVMKMDMSVDEESLKQAGVSLMRRKVLKAAMAMASSSQKMKYRLQGDLVICDDGGEKDTLTLSPDGKHLSGKIDGKSDFRLTRMK